VGLVTRGDEQRSHADALACDAHELAELPRHDGGRREAMRRYAGHMDEVAAGERVR